jgi:hypothetical protein
MTPNAHGLQSNTTETAVVQKPADAGGHDHGHHHHH